MSIDSGGNVDEQAWVELQNLGKDSAEWRRLSPSLMLLAGCRSFKQFATTFLAILDPEEFCQFCNPTGVERYVEYRGWYSRPNDFVLESLVRNILIVPTRHLVASQQLTQDDWAAIGTVFNRTCRDLDIDGCGLAMRLDDPLRNAKTMYHIHAKIVQPVGGQVYAEWFAKSKDHHQEDYVRLLEHRDELLQRGGLRWLLELGHNWRSLP